jgi:enolase
MRRYSPLLLTLLFAVFSASPAHAQLNFLKKLGLSGGSDATALAEDEIRAGLKEALKVGIDKTVALTGKKDGYNLNKKIHIPLPKNFKRVGNALSKVGFEKEVRDFELSLNRAAEAAAPQARDIFVESIGEMSMEDARRILKGSDTAATEYLQKNATPQLVEAFRPIVRKTMNKNDVMKRYNALIGKYNSPWMPKSLSPESVEKYTIEEALKGLFLILGEQEALIRKDPAARATDLLKKVFGQ